MYRYFYVVIMTDDHGFSFRKIIMSGGAMFNAELLTLDIINEINNDDSLDRPWIKAAYIHHWTEFKSKQDYEDFIR